MDKGFRHDQVWVAGQGGWCGDERTAGEGDGAEQLQHDLEGIADQSVVTMAYRLGRHSRTLAQLTLH